MNRQYAEPSLLGVGGAGIVLKVTDKHLGDQPCAVKFPRPVSGQNALLTALLDKEITHLAALRHTSIVRIHNRGTLLAQTQPVSNFPFYVMDFVAGESSSRYLDSDQAPVAEANVVRLVDSTLDAVAYLHRRSTAHLDIKPDNILVTADGVPIISDLGTAKRTGTGFPTVVACTLGYVHPDFAASLSEDPSDPNRVKGELVPSHIDLKWDLFSLGRTILNWIGYDLKGHRIERYHELTPYSRKYLLLMAARLLDGHVDEWLEDVLGLTRRLLREIAYCSVEEALLDAKKLSGKFSMVDAVPELNSYHSNTLQIGSREPVTYTERLRNLIHLPVVRRLASISQLGLVNQVYPTAMHSRLEHSLGTYHNSCQFVLSLYYDPLSPLFRQIITPRDVQLLLVSAILHDIGQYPLAHDLEEISSEVFDHQRIGFGVLAREATESQDGETLDAVLREWKVNRDEVMDLLSASPERIDAPFKTRLLRSMVDGPLDADKLDYLIRDSNRLNVPYAQGIDVDRILRSLTVIVKNEGKDALACIGVHEKARVAAEFVAMARYALFSQAYWQHTVRSMKAMLSRAVWTLLAESDVESSAHLWLEEFKQFVIDLPYKQQQDEDNAVDDPPLLTLSRRLNTFGHATSPAGASATTDNTLGLMDAAVVHYLWARLVDIKAPEAELLADLMARRLYKRLFVFSSERSDGWQQIADKWPKLSPRARSEVTQSIEVRLREAVDESADESSAISRFTLDTGQRVAMRVTAKRPVILIDVPGARPGAALPLYYVVEAQRRALRKDERAVGDVHASEVWQHFGNQLHERAGKVRVFCHPDVADILEATIDREVFLGAFEQAVRRYS